MKNLQGHPNCWAIKEASCDLYKFLDYRKHCPDIAIYSGEDAMMPYLAPAGVKGLVSVCANAWPVATKLYVEQCLAGLTQGMFPLWNNAVEALFCVANPIPVKVLMHHNEAISTSVLRPPLTHLELADHSELLAFNEQIAQWLTQVSQISFKSSIENRNIA
jgi:4-hydroxy-tetrahydrodipicolinate synthase